MDHASVQRCSWAETHADHVEYHDNEWGRPTTDPSRLFEKICLEGFQSGLSWLTILRKRDRFRHVFKQFDIYKVASFGEADIERLLGDAGIVRHRGKIEATINNAQRAIEMVELEGSFVDWIWTWAVEEPTLKLGDDESQVPAKTDRSIALAKELKSRGWKFFGPTTAYAFMQSEGLVNDHVPECHVYEVCQSERRIMLEGRELRPNG